VVQILAAATVVLGLAGAPRSPTTSEALLIGALVFYGLTLLTTIAELWPVEFHGSDFGTTLWPGHYDQTPKEIEYAIVAAVTEASLHNENLIDRKARLLMAVAHHERDRGDPRSGLPSPFLGLVSAAGWSEEGCGVGVLSATMVYSLCSAVKADAPATTRFESIERRQRTCQPGPCAPVAETDSCRRSTSLSLTFPICPQRRHPVEVSSRS